MDIYSIVSIQSYLYKLNLEKFNINTNQETDLNTKIIISNSLERMKNSNDLKFNLFNTINSVNDRIKANS